MNNNKNIIYEIAWGCCMGSSLGFPFMTAIYVSKLNEMQGLLTVGSDDIMWSMLLGPF